MKRFCLVACASVSVWVSLSLAREATAPVDYTERNAAFAPAATVQPEVRNPIRNEGLMDKRVDKTVVEKTRADLLTQKAPIAVGETHPKPILERKLGPAPAAEKPELNSWNRREASVSVTAANPPQLVSKYQTSLTAATSSNMARFPAVSVGLPAKINRFIFRKNAVQTESDAVQKPVVRAAEGNESSQAPRGRAR
jgi:hypothetical protein